MRRSGRYVLGFALLLFSATGAPGRDLSATVVEGFENYALSSSLNGLNKGKGWAGPWTKTSATNDYLIEIAPPKDVGKAIEFAASSSRAVYFRPFAADLGAGTFEIRGLVSTRSLDDVHSVALRESGVQKMLIYFDIDGHLKRKYNADNSGVEDLGPYKASKWYALRIDFNSAAHSGEYRVSVNGGATYSDWKQVTNGGTYSSINEISIESWFTTPDAVGWWDKIRVLE